VQDGPGKLGVSADSWSVRFFSTKNWLLALNEPDERDPSGLQRKAALTAMAYQFLNTAHRKNIPVIVRLKELQPGDFRGLYAIIGQCLGTQLNEVFVSLNDRVTKREVTFA